VKNDDPTLGPGTSLKLPLVISIVGAAFVVGGGLVSVRSELVKLNDSVVRLERRISDSWTERDMTLWCTLLKQANGTNLHVPDVEQVRHYTQ
jgi:hypothetical protein